MSRATWRPRAPPRAWPRATTSGRPYLGRGRDDALPWDVARSYRVAIEWTPGRFTWTRGAEGASSLSFPGTFAPRELRVRLGPPSNERGPDTTMPRGITFRDLLVVGERGAETPVCGASTTPDAGPADVTAPPPDRVGGCDPSRPITAGGFAAPPAGEGGHFRVTYTHCMGASTFRVVQFWVGERVATDVANVSGGYENGRLFAGDASCAPGETRTLRLPNGALDCATTRVERRGNDLVVEWALSFDPGTFGGQRGFFVDAKGGAGSPEPRLGWTQLGAYAVVRVPDASTTPADAGVPADTGAPVEDVVTSMPDAGPRPDLGDDQALVRAGPVGCGCAMPGRVARYDAALWALAVACAWGCGRRRVRRSSAPPGARE